MTNLLKKTISNSPVNLEVFNTPNPQEYFKTLLAENNQRLIEQFHSKTPIFDLLHARADLLDQVLICCWKHFACEDSGHFSLIAVGGYGRRELHPYSDIDILVLHNTSIEPTHANALETFFRFLWDIGLKLGHSVRTVDQCESEARDDQVITTTLIESRLLFGSESLFDTMKQRTGPNKLWPSGKFFDAKLSEQRQRYAKFNDTGFNLEPDVKEGPGGLRDFQMIAWIKKRHYNTQTLHELVANGCLDEAEYQELFAAQEFLCQVRFALHILTGRGENRLLFDYQRVLATQFGFEDSQESSAVEQFMQKYFQTVMGLERLNEMLLQLFREEIFREHENCEVVLINQNFQSLCDYIEVRDEALFEKNPLSILEIFLLQEENPNLIGIRASTIRLIRQNLHVIDDEFRQDPAAAQLFMGILAQRKGITHQLRRMNRYGVLAAYIPAFANIVGRLQYDLFHVYTVDQHTLFLIRNLRRFALDKHNDELPFCNDVFLLIGKPELLYLAALFHDIAKGKGGDHSILGETIASDFCRSHQLNEHDTQLVAWLVRNHLAMSMTAQRKDISDPDVIHEFATLVGNMERLNYIYLLTVADIRATNPDMWNAWKDSLLRQLYTATHKSLHRGLDNPVDRSYKVECTQQEARVVLTKLGLQDQTINTVWQNLDNDYFLRYTIDEAVWHTIAISSCSENDFPLVFLRPHDQRGSAEVFLYTKDKPALFYQSTAILDQLGLTIVDARIITTTHGRVLNSYQVLEQTGKPIRDLSRELDICLRLRERLLDPNYSSFSVVRREERQVRYFPIQTELNFDAEPQQNFNVLELTTADRPGLLSKVGKVFYQLKIRLHNAKITTIGNRAEDVFYISENDGCLITSGTRKQEIKQAIIDSIDGRDKVINPD